MKFSIDKIQRESPSTGESQDIILDGKNLIIVGDNGSGKTQLLNKLNSFLTMYLNGHGEISVESFEQKIKDTESWISKALPDDLNIINWKNNISSYKSSIRDLLQFNASSENLSLFRVSYYQNEAMMLFFPANRSYQSSHDMTVSSRDSIFNEYNKNKNKNGIGMILSSYFEKYLVSIWNYALLQKSTGNHNEYSRVFNIINKINKDLSELFEDESLNLSFNVSDLRINISQNNKESYTLNHLSSGYSSILAIYTELIMRAEFENISSNDLKGIVIIDEIDAHLHVSLQKKVFNFFSSAYPNIQFIISTHSPFVLQSVSDAVIYNISTQEHLKDLSLFSYTSIVKGLLGESTVSSEMEKLINELTVLTNEEIKNKRFHEIISILLMNESTLDNRAKLALLLAQNSILDDNLEGGNV